VPPESALPFDAARGMLVLPELALMQELDFISAIKA